MEIILDYIKIRTSDGRLFYFFNLEKTPGYDILASYTTYYNENNEILLRPSLPNTITESL